MEFMLSEMSSDITLLHGQHKTLMCHAQKLEQNKSTKPHHPTQRILQCKFSLANSKLELKGVITEMKKY
jgi:hypothetical protein